MARIFWKCPPGTDRADALRIVKFARTEKFSEIVTYQTDDEFFLAGDESQLDARRLEQAGVAEVHRG